LFCFCFFFIFSLSSSPFHSEEKLVVLLKSLAALQQPAEPEVLLNAVLKVTAGLRVNLLVELTVGHLAKLMPANIAAEILAPYVKLLETAVTEGDKIQYLHVLGNAGTNAPVDLLLSHLSDASVNVRSATLSSLRSHLHLPEVQEVVASMMLAKVNHHSKVVMSALISSLKQNMQNHVGFLTSFF